MYNYICFLYVRRQSVTSITEMWSRQSTGEYSLGGSSTVVGDGCNNYWMLH